MLIQDDTLRFYGSLATVNKLEPDATAAVILGAASRLGSPSSGAENAPYFLRRLSQRHVWQAECPRIVDLRFPDRMYNRLVDAGDLFPSGDLATFHSEIEHSIRCLPHFCVPIVIGGDHSISLPTIRAIRNRLRNQNLVVVVFDHHLDIQTWSPSLDPIYHTNVMSHVSMAVGDKNLVHVGVDPVQTFDEKNISLYLSELRRIGTQIPLNSRELHSVSLTSERIGRGRDIYISIDVDVLGQNEMKSTGYPSEQGMTLDLVLSIISAVAEHNRIVGCDIVEFSAERNDRSQDTLMDGLRALSILTELVGIVLDQAPREPEQPSQVSHPSVDRAYSEEPQ